MVTIEKTVCYSVPERGGIPCRVGEWGYMETTGSVRRQREVGNCGEELLFWFLQEETGKVR